jgi:energy-coupling factor transporter ATP-binding protein EcfA2
VNVGVELAATPTLLFLDEPTSGLDSTSSLMLVEQLKQMTKLGMTIIMVIHQPRYSLFTLIDDVLLLGKGGRTVYMGPTVSAKDYFEELGFQMPANENPSDWFMDVISGQLEQPNPKFPSDRLPELLFTAWEEAQNGSRQMRYRFNESAPQRKGSGRMLSRQEDREVISRHIQDAWNKVSPDAEPLSIVDFAEFLKNCIGFTPSDEIVRDLVQRIAVGHGQTRMDLTAAPAIQRFSRKDSGRLISQTDFLKYLLSFHGVSTLHSLGTMDTVDEDKEDSSDEPSVSSSDADEGVLERCLTRTFAVWSSTAQARSVIGNCSDLHRKQVGFFFSLKVVVHSNLLQWWRFQDIRMLFFSIIAFAAAFLGTMDLFIFDTPPWMPTGFLQAHISIGLLTCVYSLNCFSRDQPVFWRESSHGLNRFAFLNGRIIVDAFDWVLMCFIFTAIYYNFVGPRMEFIEYFLPFLLVAYVASGWGYVISTTLPPVLGPFAGAVLSFSVAGIFGLPEKMGIFLDGGWLEALVSIICFTRWSVPMDFLTYIDKFPQNKSDMDIIISAQYDMYTAYYAQSHWKIPDFLVGSDDDAVVQWWSGLVALLIMGTVLRGAAYLGLVFVNRSKQV